MNTPDLPPIVRDEKSLDAVQAWMEQKGGKPVSREDAREAAVNLAGVARTLIGWIKHADATDPGWRERARARRNEPAATDFLAEKANTKE